MNRFYNHTISFEEFYRYITQKGVEYGSDIAVLLELYSELEKEYEAYQNEQEQERFDEYSRWDLEAQIEDKDREIRVMRSEIQELKNMLRFLNQDEIKKVLTEHDTKVRELVRSINSWHETQSVLKKESDAQIAHWKKVASDAQERLDFWAKMNAPPARYIS